jgi:hypothetical protein
MNGCVVAMDSDWRLQWQDKYLSNVELLRVPYEPYRKGWEHDHCAFCSEAISNFKSDLHNGYCTLDRYHWICEKCFNDFKDIFKWQVR